MRKRERYFFRMNFKKEQEPIHGNLVWVQCIENRCLAYIDSEGNWINFYTGKKLNDFVKVVAS